jgi:hypothetical protein
MFRPSQQPTYVPVQFTDEISGPHHLRHINKKIEPVQELDSNIENPAIVAEQKILYNTSPNLRRQYAVNGYYVDLYGIKRNNEGRRVDEDGGLIDLHGDWLPEQDGGWSNKNRKTRKNKI